MNAVAAWARGMRFSEVLKMAEVFEGSLVRAVRRLEELLHQVRGAGAGRRSEGRLTCVCRRHRP